MAWPGLAATAHHPRVSSRPLLSLSAIDPSLVVSTTRALKSFLMPLRMFFFGRTSREEQARQTPWPFHHCRWLLAGSRKRAAGLRPCLEVLHVNYILESLVVLSLVAVTSEDSRQPAYGPHTLSSRTLG
jgi:hypothetical protein